MAFVAVCLASLPTAAAAQSASKDDVSVIIRARLAGPAGAVLSDGAAPLAVKSLRSFYAGRDYAPAWNSGPGFKPLAGELLGVIRSARRQGLSPAVYHERLIEQAAKTPYGQYSARGKAGVDLLMSDALLGYATDLLYGRAAGADSKGSAIDAPEDVNLDHTVAQALSSGRLEGLVRRLAPVPAAYGRLQDALARLRSLEPLERPLRLPERTLHPGDSGSEVVALRGRLALLGDLPPADENGSDVLDPPLVAAVKHFQSRWGLEPDGTVGRKTRAALEVPLSKRIEKIKLNLERWRWLPRDPGDRYIIVNIAAQELRVIENRRSTLSMRVIVGKPFRRTPSFASRITEVVLNPYWRVPRSIAVNEILPILRRDPDYLEREHMEVLRESGTETVDPATIDWKKMRARGFPYRFRQKPGPDNALGRVKFVLPNRYNVYLHDTPAKSLFAHANRCFSHGCVRLEKPRELANLLLDDQAGWGSERVEKTLETEQDFHVRLTHPMPVYLVYWTAWVDRRGAIHFRNDIYGRDKHLKSVLRSLGMLTTEADQSGQSGYLAQCHPGVIADPALARAHDCIMENAVCVEGPYRAVVHFHREAEADGALGIAKEVHQPALELGNAGRRPVELQAGGG